MMTWSNHNWMLFPKLLLTAYGCWISFDAEWSEQFKKCNVDKTPYWKFRVIRKGSPQKVETLFQSLNQYRNMFMLGKFQTNFLTNSNLFVSVYYFYTLFISISLLFLYIIYGQQQKLEIFFEYSDLLKVQNKLAWHQLTKQ